MARFLLLLYDDQEDRDAWHQLTPEEMEEGLEEYEAWTEKPFVVTGQRLGEDVGRVIRARDGRPHVTDGPFSETKEVLGGYYAIEARDYDEAVNLALDHPHLKHGGAIEVRQFYDS